MSTTGQRNILLEAHQDLEKQLHSLLTDVEDLEASVLAVEQAGDRWSIAEHEVKARRRFLETVKAEVQVRIRQRGRDARHNHLMTRSVVKGYPRRFFDRREPAK
jgi:syntaxin 6